uniref:Uncharacterized protein n=1 Tax=Helianthus annuus TaxID=4232 RepID=A0A251S388_HELAN
MSGGERERCMREREIKETEPRFSGSGGGAAYQQRGGGNPVPFGFPKHCWRKQKQLLKQHWKKWMLINNNIKILSHCVSA